MKYWNIISGICLMGLLSIAAQCNKSGNPGSAHQEPPPSTPSPSMDLKADVWMTKADSSVLLKKTNTVSFVTGTVTSGAAITVDSSQLFQDIDGFGYTLTGGSAMLINKMNAKEKADLLLELFGKGEGSIGVSYLRISVGASDLDPAPFSYNDLPSGQTDAEQAGFSIAPDKKDLIPVLKDILVINPAIKILASPWSPPAWMKDNKATKGGSLMPEFYASYALYWVKYIQAMKAEGIPIDALTIQNEPLHPGNNPSMYMTAEQQRDFIKHHLGPALANSGIKTKIILYDHNLDRPDYPISIMNDPEAKKYVDGSAFHLYNGEVGAMTTVHNAHPDKNLYFTEQWTGSNGSFNGDLKWHIKNVIIGTMQNWSRVALEWNLASDPGYHPHTDGGCSMCKGALTINNNAVIRNVAYYIIAHASKFVPAASKRIYSTSIDGIANVAFTTPNGKKVMIALNEAGTDKSVSINFAGKTAVFTIPSNTVATIVW